MFVWNFRVLSRASKYFKLFLNIQDINPCFDNFLVLFNFCKFSYLISNYKFRILVFSLSSRRGL